MERSEAEPVDHLFEGGDDQIIGTTCHRGVAQKIDGAVGRVILVHLAPIDGLSRIASKTSLDW